MGVTDDLTLAPLFRCTRCCADDRDVRAGRAELRVELPEAPATALGARPPGRVRGGMDTEAVEEGGPQPPLVVSLPFHWEWKSSDSHMAEDGSVR